MVKEQFGWLGAKGARPLPLCFLGHEGTGRGGGEDIGWVELQKRGAS